MLAVALAAAALAACSSGSQGPQGPTGTPGCPGLAAGQTPGLHANVSIAAATNGQYFSTGDRPIVTVKLTNDCGTVLGPSQIEQAWLLLGGPRDPLLTKTAAKMLNTSTDRTSSQHHHVDLKSPSYAVAGQNNLAVAPDGTMTYTFSPISDEAPGTYTASVWAKNAQQHDQVFQSADFQIGTSTVESYASGAADSASCLACHAGNNGKVYMHHVEPGFSPFGDYALDSAPIASCKQCHNQDGYSANPTLRKVHGVHRGANLQAKDQNGNMGVAHPEYGLAADATMSSFTNVTFPSFPGDERDCTKCHTSDSWKTSPSRLACGTCHDNLFFDDKGNGYGALVPARVVGKPAGGACTTAYDPASPIAPECSALGAYLSCNTTTGNCERRVHPAQASDAQCSVCHVAASPAPGAASSIVDVHAIAQRVNDPGLVISNVTLIGATGTNGTYRVGDPVGFKFSLSYRTGAAVTDFKTSSSFSGTAIVAGPTSAMQRVFPAQSLKTQGTLTFDGTQTYTYTFAATRPANAAPPVNVDPSAQTQANPPGSYTVWFYVTKSVNGQTEATDHAETVRFVDATLPLAPRQVVTRDACNACHVDVQAHGGSRRNPQTCSTCHNQGAMDRVASPASVAGTGLACLADTDCPGGAMSPQWETCVGANPPTKGICTMSQDPTPGVTIDLPQLAHRIHYARKLEGYAERNALFNPGQLQYVGFRNSLLNFSDILLPKDVRNCQSCHADTGATCSSSAPCGYGQTCNAGKCVNTAWQQPSARACISCHDADDAAAHAAINTSNGIETCNVCHGPDAEFSVANVHDISSPYVPPYTRE
jgi:hypothetical protein